MENCFKLKLIAVVVLIISGVAHAGVVNISDNGSVDNPYLMGIVGTSSNILAATMAGNPGSLLEESANFTIPVLSTTLGSANTYSLKLGGTDVSEITGWIVEVWSDAHPSGSTLFGSLSENNATHFIGDLAAGQYHLDISGNLRNSIYTGQYSVALQKTLPVPELETYTMLLAGLGLVGFSVCRRR